MSVTLERETVAPPRRPRSSRWAWVAALSSPVSCAVAIWMSFFVLGDENITWWGDVIVALMVFGPPVLAVVLGTRSGRSGNRLGDHASAVAAGWAGFLVTFWYAANYPFNGESGAVPLALGALAALALAGVVEALARRRHRGKATSSVQ